MYICIKIVRISDGKERKKDSKRRRKEYKIKKGSRREKRRG